MKSLPYAIAALTLTLAVATWSQPYELNWSHRTVPVQQAQQDAPPVPVEAPPAAPFRLPSSAESKRLDISPSTDTRRTERAEPMDVQIVAEQSYDHYNSRYRKVARVESLVYRGGYPQDLVHCNRARYDSFDIFLEDLEMGDRYKVRVTWDDGSHRTIERTIGPMSATSVFVREPLAYDSSFES